MCVCVRERERETLVVAVTLCIVITEEVKEIEPQLSVAGEGSKQQCKVVFCQLVVDKKKSKERCIT